MNQSLTVNINLDAVVAPLHRTIKQTTECVAFALIAADRLEDKELLSNRNEPSKTISLPAVHCSFFTSAEPTNVAEVRHNVRLWSITNGLRDQIERVGSVLEELRQVCEILLLGKGPFEKPVNLREVVSKGARAFQRRGLPDKIEFLDRMMQSKFRGPLTDSILSINQARNCLVHRYGQTSEEDVSEFGALVVHWKRWQLFCRDEFGNEMAFSIPGEVLAGQELQIRECDAQKSFMVGQTIDFDAQEFNDIGWTLNRYAQECVRRFQDYWAGLGLLNIEVKDAPGSVKNAIEELSRVTTTDAVVSEIKEKDAKKPGGGGMGM